MEKLVKISKMYPNFMKSDLPHTVRCALEDVDEPDLPFRRTLPKMFEIQTVWPFKPDNTPYCTWEVEYYLKNGANLPVGRGLTSLVKHLTKFTPSNTTIIEKDLHLPKTISITYGVLCNCCPTNLEMTATLPKFPKQFYVFKINNSSNKNIPRCECSCL